MFTAHYVKCLFFRAAGQLKAAVFGNSSITCEFTRYPPRLSIRLGEVSVSRGSTVFDLAQKIKFPNASLPGL